MSWQTGVLAVCVLVMSIGQVLFKQVAINYNNSTKFLALDVAGLLILAGGLYVASTGMWVWLLRHVEISKAYPFFAMGFVIVPLLGMWLFGEQLDLKYALGASFIVLGVLLTSSAV